MVTVHKLRRFEVYPVHATQVLIEQFAKKFTIESTHSQTVNTIGPLSLGPGIEASISGIIMCKSCLGTKAEKSTSNF